MSRQSLPETAGSPVLAVISFFGEQVDGHPRALLESLSVRVAG
ncbi:hypothetical protein [Streptomyces sp. NPDC003522]